MNALQISRRRFFLGASLNTEESPTREVWSFVGRLSDFFPESSQLVTLKNAKVIVFSTVDGLFAITLDALLEKGRKKLLPMQLDRMGGVSVDVNGSWPEGAALSILTGGMQMTEPSFEGVDQ